MRVLLLCTAIAGAVMLGGPPARAEAGNPLYVPPSDTQTNPLAGSGDAVKSGGPGHAAASDASAGKGHERTAPTQPAGPVKWSAPEMDSQQKKGAMGNVQSNPLYQDNGAKGENPLHDPKGMQGNNPMAEKKALSDPGPAPDGADAAMWPHMHQTATHQREAVEPPAPSPGQPQNPGDAAGKGMQHLHKEGIVHRDLAARTVTPGDEATDKDKPKADEARERAAQDARQAAQPPMMPPVMPPPIMDFPKGGMP